jgi:hypothetical protein
MQCVANMMQVPDFETVLVYKFVFYFLLYLSVKEMDGRECIGLIWLRIGTGGWLL